MDWTNWFSTNFAKDLVHGLGHNLRYTLLAKLDEAIALATKSMGQPGFSARIRKNRRNRAMEILDSFCWNQAVIKYEAISWRSLVKLIFWQGSLLDWQTCTSQGSQKYVQILYSNDHLFSNDFKFIHQQSFLLADFNCLVGWISLVLSDSVFAPSTMVKMRRKVLSRFGLGPTRLPRAHEAKASNLSKLREVPSPGGGNDTKRRRSPDMMVFHILFMGYDGKPFEELCFTKKSLPPRNGILQWGVLDLFPLSAWDTSSSGPPRSPGECDLQDLLCSKSSDILKSKHIGSQMPPFKFISASWDCIIPDRTRKSSELPTQKHNSSGLSLLSRLLFSFWQFLPIAKTWNRLK